MPRTATSSLYAAGIAGLMVAGLTAGSLFAAPRDQEPASRPQIESSSAGEAAASKQSAESLKAAESDQGKRKQDLRGMLLLWVLRNHPLQ